MIRKQKQEQVINNLIKLSGLILMTSFLSACSTLTGLGKDNTPPPAPLVAFQPEMTPVQLWSNNAGSGTHDMVVKLVPVLVNNMVITADQRGNISATDATTGRTIWQTPLNTPLTAGMSTNGSIVIVSTSDGVLYALQPMNGHILWRTPLPNQILGVPEITYNRIALETVDGKLLTLDAQTGQTIWLYDHGAPTLILRGGSSPQITSNKIIAGYSDGKLAAYSLSNGSLIWEHTVSEPMGATDIEQMIDVVADPIVADGVVYTVNYQGNILAVDANSGQVIWQHPLSSYTGMALSNHYLFVTDANGYVWAFDKTSGDVIWRQMQLANRILSAPVVQGDSIAVGDGEGFVHWLAQQDGRFIARVSTAAAGISAPPAVYGNRLYVLNNAGLLTAYGVR